VTGVVFANSDTNVTTATQATKLWF